MKKLAIVIFATTITHTATATAMQGMEHEHDDHQASAESAAGVNQMQDMGSSQSMGDMGTDPWLTYLKVDQLEWRDADEASITSWDVSAWSGKSIDKLWFNAEGERVRGHTEQAETQLLYGHAISSFWDMQAGVRSDLDPQPDRHWATLGVRGLAPYWFDIDAKFFIADHGHTAARIKGEYELLLTQKLVLVPDIEINAYSKDDVARGIGSGLSDIEAGLRLKYEFIREVAPYIGIVHERKLGTTADIAHEQNEDTQQTMFVAGISLWF